MLCYRLGRSQKNNFTKNKTHKSILSQGLSFSKSMSEVLAANFLGSVNESSSGRSGIQNQKA